MWWRASLASTRLQRQVSVDINDNILSRSVYNNIPIRQFTWSCGNSPTVSRGTMHLTETNGKPTVPALNLQRPIRLGLPFVVYELQLRHRLLDNLQSVSRFLLRALARGVTRDMILAVTALSAETIDAQCDYLRYQGYLGDSLTLAPLGEEVVQLERLLPLCVKRIGVDKFNGKNIFVLPMDEAALRAANAGSVPDATLPEERHLKQFDHQNRVAEILLDKDGAGLLQFLNYFWPEHGALFARQLRYFDCRLRPLSNHPAERLNVNVDGGRLVSVPKLRQRDPGVVLPVLEIERYSEVAPEWPWPVALPPSDFLWVDLFSHTSLAAGLPLVDTTDDQLRVLADSTGHATPDLPSILAPAGVQVGHTLRRRYLNLRVEGSLMDLVHAEYGFLILGDADA